MSRNSSRAPTGPWVRVRLSAGQSDGQAWEVGAAQAGARVDVGSDPSCVWRVEAPGVAPRHLELYWDGQTLWVTDVGRVGPVRADGLLVDQWYACAHGTRIEFGAARLLVEAGGAPGPEVLATHDRSDEGPTRLDHRPGGAPPPMRDEPPTVAVGNAASYRSELPALDRPVVRRARPLPSPSHGAAQSPGVSSGGDPTRHAIPLLAAASAPLMGTQIVDALPSRAMPGPEPSVDPRLAPRLGGAPASDEPPTVRPAPEVPNGVPGAVPNPLVSPMAGIDTDASAEPSTTPGTGHAGFTVRPRFVPPPPPSATPTVRRPTAGDPHQALPLRTWVLFAVTVVLFCWLYLWDDEPGTADQADEGVTSAPVESEPAPLPPAVEPVGTGAARPDAPIEEPPPPDEGDQIVSTGPAAVTAEREAADALWAGGLDDGASR
ncbi:MAG: hypothetical protein NZ898_13440 [Myxococcota bacterium]|nr:hypothetical protein [Myxococcota bacterium]